MRCLDSSVPSTGSEDMEPERERRVIKVTIMEVNERSSLKETVEEKRLARAEGVELGGNTCWLEAIGLKKVGLSTTQL